MRVATWAAGVAIAVGLAILVGYWMVLVLSALFGTDEAPVLVKVAVPSLMAGAAVLLLTAVLQRVRDRKEEDLEGVEH
jgi:chromate transport protein ChrA